jgi:hypothetical protein
MPPPPTTRTIPVTAPAAPDPPGLLLLTGDALMLATGLTVMSLGDGEEDGEGEAEGDGEALR